MRYHLKKHKYKIVVGVPMAVLLASSLSLMRSPDQVYIVPGDTTYVEVGDVITLHVVADSDEPINVVGAVISIPKEYIEVTSISRENSIIDLWTEEPNTDSDNKLTFSGGILREGGFIGSGIIITINARAIAEGRAPVTFDEVSMLAHDGTGRPVDHGTNPITLSVRAKELPSPDINGDKFVNLYDFGLVSARLFLSYNRSYDLNLDGRITFADISIVLANFGQGHGQQSSLALLAR